ncbi:hypothetical protein PILCRDRAFT_460608 [Piloderma croceum F 1598]|uniref:Uncharacterized protein n=1 Tax=Piloderma croceum (strain F 1598) TaxID=765440 RepID=A0A0C3B9C8_PILCF|nr:hypothetical protein PILCRDRAFT_460608 [Piloderma croceum F 1598]
MTMWQRHDPSFIRPYNLSTGPPSIHHLGTSSLCGFHFADSDKIPKLIGLSCELVVCIVIVESNP